MPYTLGGSELSRTIDNNSRQWGQVKGREYIHSLSRMPRVNLWHLILISTTFTTMSSLKLPSYYLDVNSIAPDRPYSGNSQEEAGTARDKLDGHCQMRCEGTGTTWDEAEELATNRAEWPNECSPSDVGWTKYYTSKIAKQDASKHLVLQSIWPCAMNTSSFADNWCNFVEWVTQCEQYRHLRFTLFSAPA